MHVVHVHYILATSNQAKKSCMHVVRMHHILATANQMKQSCMYGGKTCLQLWCSLYNSDNALHAVCKALASELGQNDRENGILVAAQQMLIYTLTCIAWQPWLSG